MVSELHFRYRKWIACLHKADENSSFKVDVGIFVSTSEFSLTPQMFASVHVNMKQPVGRLSADSQNVCGLPSEG